MVNYTKRTNIKKAYCDIIVDRWKKLMVKSGKEFTIKKNGELQDG